MKVLVPILFVVAALLGDPVLAASAVMSSPTYKIAIHQVNPNGKEHHVVCWGTAKKCHFVLPLKSRTGVGTVDVDVQFENGQPCLTFLFGTTTLLSEVGCVKSPSSQIASLYFPGEPEKSKSLSQDLVGRSYYRVVAEIAVSVTTAHH